MNKYRCYYTNDFRDEYDAPAKQDEHGEWYRVEDVDARIAELEKTLRGCREVLDRYRFSGDGEDEWNNDDVIAQIDEIDTVL